MLRQISYPIIFAHRGASAHAPENTVASFELALRQGADAIELDAKLCQDGHVVVIHDKTVDRTTDGSGRVSELTLDELRELDAGSFFDFAFRREQIPTLDEVFKLFGHRTFINVELSNYLSPFDALPLKVARLVKKHRLIGRVMFSSFHPIPLLRVQRYLPEVPLGLLALSGRKGSLHRSWLGRLIPYRSLHIAQSDATKKFIDHLHQLSKRVYVYTCNDPETIQGLSRLRVDGVFTDDPLMARRVLATVQD